MKLYSFHYSPYVQKVRAVLDLLGRDYTVMEVAYGDRTELATLTGGYVHVPVLADDAGRVVCDSRRICEHLLSDAAAAAALYGQLAMMHVADPALPRRLSPTFTAWLDRLAARIPTVMGARRR